MRLAQLKKQIREATGNAPARGVVTNIAADRLQVATGSGLREYPAVKGIAKGDAVTIIAGVVTAQTGKDIEVYYL